MTERDLYRAIKEALPEPHWTRIENGAGVGEPDINCCYRGIEFWLELKIGPPKLRPAQYAWSMRRAKQGGRVYILARVVDYLAVWKYPNVVVTPLESHLKVCINEAKIFTFISPWRELINYLTGP